MYDLSDHAAMVADPIRMRAYTAALEHAVTPQSCVLDIGSGTGIFAMLAARLGARSVYAIESQDIIGLARKLVHDNGLDDRIRLIHGDARRVELPERADVIVSDIGGHLPWYRQHLPVINHAQEHFLGPGGAMIPCADRIFAAVVAGKSDDPAGVWSKKPHGLDFSAAAAPAAAELEARSFKARDLLSAPVPVAALDYREALDVGLDRKLALEIAREGAACGLVLWFDRDLDNGIRIENGPAADAMRQSRRIYHHALLSWPSVLALTPGDTVSAHIRATLEEEDYDWRWDSEIRCSVGGETKTIRFSQSSSLPPPETPPGEDPGGLSEDGQALCLCLSLMKTGADNEAIVHALMRDFPARFPTRRAALAHVAALCREYA